MSGRRIKEKKKNLMNERKLGCINKKWMETLTMMFRIEDIMKCDRAADALYISYFSVINGVIDMSF